MRRVVGISTGTAAPVASRPSAAEQALLAAASEGNHRRLRGILESNGNVGARDERGRTALMLAAIHGHLRAMRVLVEAGADLNAGDGGRRRWPCLMHAIDADRASAALALLDWGADPTAREESGYSALMMAASRGDRWLVQELLSRGADPEAELFLGFTALDYAIGYGHAEVVRLLLDAAPQLRQRHNSARRSVLALATDAGDDEILRLVASPDAGGI